MFIDVDLCWSPSHGFEALALQIQLHGVLRELILTDCRPDEDGRSDARNERIKALLQRMMFSFTVPAM
jgi:hypothetical protein